MRKTRTNTHVETRLAASPAAGLGVAAFRRALLRWYGRHRRDLPWRRTRDPYRIWLSEIMLQQTRVAAVLEHYRAFLERFPTVEVLAAAPLDAVLAVWSGLGYYRRARMLHQCARAVVREHAGHFPQTSATLLTLPGIGRYTAAATASIAFDEPVAVVDGNVERVVQRLAGRDLVQPEIWRQAQSLLHASRPGDFNQAMMELGATVCLPRDPRCPICPVRKWCAAHAQAGQRKSPATGRRKSLPATPASSNGRQLKREVWCVLHERDSQVRLVQRAANSSLMPGMWELPQFAETVCRPQDSPPWRSFRHSITVTNYTVHVLRQKAPGKGKWVATADIPQFPITGLTRKILRAARII